jgi:hypothetical protein
MTKETYTVKAKQSKSEVWLVASGMVLVPLVAAIAVLTQLWLQ